MLLTQLPNKQLQKLHNNEADVAAQSKAWACGRSLAGIAGSKPAWHGCLSLVDVVCLQVEGSAADRSLVRKSPTKWCVRQSVI
jgi:hypothetical protein